MTSLLLPYLRCLNRQLPCLVTADCHVYMLCVHVAHQWWRRKQTFSLQAVESLGCHMFTVWNPLLLNLQGVDSLAVKSSGCGIRRLSDVCGPDSFTCRLCVRLKKHRAEQDLARAFTSQQHLRTWASRKRVSNRQWRCLYKAIAIWICCHSLSLFDICYMYFDVFCFLLCYNKCYSTSARRNHLCLWTMYHAPYPSNRGSNRSG